MKKLMMVLLVMLGLAAQGMALNMFYEGLSATANGNSSAPNITNPPADYSTFGAPGVHTDNPPTGMYWFDGFSSSNFYDNNNASGAPNSLAPCVTGQTQFRANFNIQVSILGLVQGDTNTIFEFGNPPYIYCTFDLLNSVTGICQISFGTNNGAADLVCNTFNLTTHIADWLYFQTDFNGGIRTITFVGYKDSGGTFHADGTVLATDDISGSFTSTEPEPSNESQLLGRLAGVDGPAPFAGALNGIQFLSNATFTPTHTPTPTNTPIATPDATLPRLLSVIGGGAEDQHLYYLDPADGSMVAARVLVPPSSTIKNCNALARRPTTGLLYVVYATVAAPNTRQLAMVNETTGVLTNVHSVGNVNGLAFDTAGNGWATQKAAGPSAPINLHQYNVTSWSDTDKGDITPSDYCCDSALAFNPNDGLLYFAYNDDPAGQASLETIELSGYTKTELGEIQGDIFNIPFFGPGYVGSMAWNPVDGNLFTATINGQSYTSNLYGVSTTASSSTLIGGNALEYQKGLVYMPASGTNTPTPTPMPTSTPTPLPTHTPDYNDAPDFGFKYKVGVQMVP